MTIAVLALQGAFIEHEQMLQKLGVHTIELRQASDLQKDFDGIILPGGESTVQGKLLKELDMFDTIKKQIEEGMPVLSTCAGLILLAKDIKDQEETYFGTIPMTFIRAPYVESVEEGVKVLAEVDGNIVGVEYGNQIGVAFHPELDENLRVHEKFISRL